MIRPVRAKSGGDESTLLFRVFEMSMPQTARRNNKDRLTFFQGTAMKHRVTWRVLCLSPCLQKGLVFL